MIRFFSLKNRLKMKMNRMQLLKENHNSVTLINCPDHQLTLKVHIQLQEQIRPEIYLINYLSQISSVAHKLIVKLKYRKKL